MNERTRTCIYERRHRNGATSMKLIFFSLSPMSVDWMRIFHKASLHSTSDFEFIFIKARYHHSSIPKIQINCMLANVCE